MDHTRTTKNTAPLLIRPGTLFRFKLDRHAEGPEIRAGDIIIYVKLDIKALQMIPAKHPHIVLWRGQLIRVADWLIRKMELITDQKS